MHALQSNQEMEEIEVVCRKSYILFFNSTLLVARVSKMHALQSNQEMEEIAVVCRKSYIYSVWQQMPIIWYVIPCNSP